MGKRDPLAKFEDWKAPWEVDSTGTPIAEDEQKVDTARLRKFLYNLLGDRQKLQTDFDSEKARAEELEDKVAKAADPAKLAELQAEVVKAQKERDDAAAEAKKNGASDLEVLKLRVALNKGLTEVQARRLLGSTKEELEQDAEELLASFGGKGKSGEDDGVARGPKRVFTNSGDPDSGREGDEEEEVDPEKWAASYAARRGRGIR